MKFQSSLSILRWVSLILIFVAIVLTVFQLIAYSQNRNYYPAGQTIASIPVGGLDRQDAGQRLLEIYATNIEIHYLTASIQVKPSTLGFSLELENMLTAADIQRTSNPFWTGFWDYLWNRTRESSDVPLRATISEDRIRSFLQDEIAPRYDQDPSPSIPIPGSVSFQSGQPGTVLDINRTVELVVDALKSPTAREVNLTINTTEPARPSIQNLQILIQQTIDLAGFDGLTELYLHDLTTSEELHFAYQNGEQIPTDIAFTAASTMKIPVMVSVYHYITGPTPESIQTLLTEMIDRSDNDSTDRLAKTAIDANRAPLLVSADMETLGLENTFWAGFFTLGSPKLKDFSTDANERTDISTDPDSYNQTTPMDIGLLLTDIYECSKTGGGALPAAFNGEITQTECEEMISYLAGNHIAVLLQGGLPDGTTFAHKHGWLTDTSDGLIHTMGDSGIVYSPGGDYVITIYLYDQEQLVFDPVNQMVGEISTAVYNYFNQAMDSQ